MSTDVSCCAVWGERFSYLQVVHIPALYRSQCGISSYTPADDGYHHMLHCLDRMENYEVNAPDTCHHCKYLYSEFRDSVSHYTSVPFQARSYLIDPRLEINCMITVQWRNERSNHQMLELATS